MTLCKTVAGPNGGTQVAMTDDEEAVYVAQQALDNAAATTAALVNQASQALTASDMTATRCIKAGVSFPPEWLAYVAALRVVVSSGTGTLPIQPAYPAGT